MNNSNSDALQVATNSESGQIASVRLYGEELLDTSALCQSELWVNGLPLTPRQTPIKLSSS